jgi:drug/metabolite transporter (DMT)-like permease
VREERVITSEQRTHAAFAGAVLIGGANFVAVSFSNMELPPLFGAALRFGAAGVVFVVIARLAGVPPARGRAAGGAALYGLLGFGAAYALLYYALVGLSAGTVAVVMASMPLFTLGIAAALGQERLSVRGVAGALLALAGIAVLSAGTLGGELGSGYLAAALLGTIAASASTVVARGVREVHPLNMNAIGMVAGTALLVAGSLALGEGWVLPRAPGTLLAVGWLVLLGSLGLFQLFLYVVRRWSASATVYAITAMPVVAVGLGAVLLRQPVTGHVVAGGALVMTAVYIGAISRPRAVTAADAAPAVERAPGRRPGP